MICMIDSKKDFITLIDYQLFYNYIGGIQR